MGRKAVVISAVALLLLGLLAVPTISILSQGCNAGSRGILDWLPQPWDRSFLSTDQSCESAGLLSEGYQALCQSPKRGALQQLLYTIGLIGPSGEEQRELTICVYGKGVWSWLTNSLVESLDAALDLHHSVSGLMEGDFIKWQHLVEPLTQTTSGGSTWFWNRLKELGSNMALPFVKVTNQFNDEYIKLREFYHNIRASPNQLTSENIDSDTPLLSGGADISENWKHVEKGFLLPTWQYITCNTAKFQTEGTVSEAASSQPDPHLYSGTENQGPPPSVEKDDAIPNKDLENLITQDYLAQLVTYVTNPTRERLDEVHQMVLQSGPVVEAAILREKNWIEKEISKAATQLEEESVDLVEIDEMDTMGKRPEISRTDVVSPAEEDELPGDKNVILPMDVHSSIPAEDVNETPTPSTDAYSHAVKKVLFESLIATVLAFALFMIGVFFQRVIRSQLLGFQLPSLVNAVISRYRPIRLIKAAEDFNTFHMVCKRTRQNVAVKCLQAASTSSARIDFRTELHSLKRLKHPNVVTLIDCIQSGPNFCLGLEYAPYGDLKWAACNPAKTFGFEQKIGVYKQILEGVNWMHKSGWAHLNIRPGTVLVFEQWCQVKLSGFTSAVECLKRDLCHNYDLHPMCSPPSVITKQPYDPKKADLWSLGCLLYFIFTQKEVSSQEGALRLARIVRRMDYERQYTFAGLNLIKLLSDLLSFHPGNRPELSDLIVIIDNLS